MFGRALKAGEKEPILKPYILRDEVEKLAEDKGKPELNDSGFARLMKVVPHVNLQEVRLLIESLPSIGALEL